MARLRVTVMDEAGARRCTAELPAKVPMIRLVPELALRMGLLVIDGCPHCGYVNGELSLNVKRLGRSLHPAETLAQAGVVCDDELRFVREISNEGHHHEVPVFVDLNTLHPPVGQVYQVGKKIRRLLHEERWREGLSWPDCPYGVPVLASFEDRGQRLLVVFVNQITLEMMPSALCKYLGVQVWQYELSLACYFALGLALPRGAHPVEQLELTRKEWPTDSSERLSMLVYYGELSRCCLVLARRDSPSEH